MHVLYNQIKMLHFQDGQGITDVWQMIGSSRFSTDGNLKIWTGDNLSQTVHLLRTDTWYKCWIPVGLISPIGLILYRCPDIIINFEDFRKSMNINETKILNENLMMRFFSDAIKFSVSTSQIIVTCTCAAETIQFE